MPLLLVRDGQSPQVEATGGPSSQQRWNSLDLSASWRLIVPGAHARARRATAHHFKM